MMYQLIVCDTCEDGSCQAWRDRLKVFRNKLTNFIVIPVESTPLTQSHTTENAPLIEPEDPHAERLPSPLLTHFSTSNPSRSYGGRLETTLSYFYFMIYFLLVLAAIFSLFSFCYACSAWIVPSHLFLTYRIFLPMSVLLYLFCVLWFIRIRHTIMIRETIQGEVLFIQRWVLGYAGREIRFYQSVAKITYTSEFLTKDDVPD